MGMNRLHIVTVEVNQTTIMFDTLENTRAIELNCESIPAPDISHKQIGLL